jgi:hypothetical protein
MMRILVLGSSFGGLTAALEVKRLLCKKADVTAVSDDDRFVGTVAEGLVREILSVQDEARNQQPAVGSARIVENAVVFVLIIFCSYDMIFHLHGMTLRKENRAP